MRLRSLGAAALVLTSPWALTAGSPSAAAFHVPLRTQSGIPIVWKAFPVKYSINDQGSDNVNDDSETLAIRLAFAEWHNLSGTGVKLTELTSASSRAISDWRPFGTHIVVFDEDGDPDILPGGSNIIAVTPVAYDAATGKILDADIVLNGSDFVFSTTLVNGTMDIWSTTTHEAGHFLGLDHTGIAASTMWPFEGLQSFTTRTISDDERAGMRALYPKAVKGAITGFAKRASNGTVVKGAHVWARSTIDGRVAAGGFTDGAGAYTIHGLEPGTYRVVAGPLDGPMTGNNLSNFNKSGLESNFSVGSSSAISILAAETVAAPDVLVGLDAAINITSPSTAIEIHPGASLGVNLGGTGLAGATVTVPDSGAAFVVTGTAPNFTLTASAGALPGFYDLVVTNGAAQSTDWSGGIEVLPPALTLSTVVPAFASTAGGTTIVLTGTNFAGTPKVVLGDVLATNVHVVSPTKITATAPKHADVAVAVSVVGESGEPVDYFGNFQFVAGVNPGVTSVFPQAGSDAGGTAVTILGSSFQDGAVVKFGGVNGTNVEFVSATEIRAVSPALAAGTYDVLVVNPGAGGLTATAVNGFTTVPGADPALTSSTPDEVPSTGGETLTLAGTGFDVGDALTFFADTKTGTGGLPATPDLVDPTSITLTAPANVKLNKSFVGDAPVVLTKSNGQTAIATGILTYVPLMVKNGNLSGSVAPAADVDRVFVDAIAGTVLTLKATAVGTPILTPQIVLKDRNAAVIGTAGETGSKVASLTTGPLPSTGRYAIEVSGLDGTTGKYKFIFRETLPKSQTNIPIPANPPTAVGPGQALFAFEAKPGFLLKGSITGKNGLLPIVASLDGPSGSILGDPNVSSKILIVNGGRTIQFKGVPLTELGAYALSIGASGGTTGTITGSLTITAPKSVKIFVEK